jgi:serine/threonine protein phosphatase PrpC
MATLTLLGYKGGSPESQINQDRAFVLSPFRVGEVSEDEAEDGTTCRLLGVFDGHAPLGEHVSEYVVTELPKLLAKKLELVTDQESTKEALVESFIEMDKTVPAHKSGGCTASVILQMGRKVYVANAGDSRSFIAVYHKQSRKTQIVYVSREDKPDLPEERKRVESVGGQVYISNRVGGTSRVLYTDPMTGYQSGLAMSRSIGDWEAGKVGVIPDPIVDVIDIPNLVTAERNMCVVIDENGDMNMEFCVGDQVDDVHIFAVSATDGMFDFVDPLAIAETIAPSLFDEDGSHPLTACENLISTAASGWQGAKQGRYRDDIAIAVCTIRIPPPRVNIAQ